MDVANLTNVYTAQISFAFLEVSVPALTGYSVGWQCQFVNTNSRQYRHI
jgi:hypothetical protein